MGNIEGQPRDDRTPQESSDLLRAIVQKTFELGQATVALYQSGKFTEDSLVDLCDELLSLESQMRAEASRLSTATQVEESLGAAANAADEKVDALSRPTISTEEQAEGSPSHQPLTCPQCGEESEESKKFCTACGYKMDVQVDNAPRNLAPSVDFDSEPVLANSVPAAPVCPFCSALLRPDAKFCTACGRAVAEIVLQNDVTQIEGPFAGPIASPGTFPAPQAVQQTNPDKFCDNCGRGVAADVTTCPDCGGEVFSEGLQ